MARNIQARRKLSDLYRRGVEVRFDESGGHIGPFDADLTPDEAEEQGVVRVWVAPPSPLQRDQSMREAQAARARAMLMVKRDKDSEEHLTSMNFVADMSDATLVDYVLMGTQEERRNEAIREVLGLEEWKEFSVFQDAMRQFEEDETPEDDPEFAALIEKDTEYGKQVNARYLEITEAEMTMLGNRPREQLEVSALEKRAELVGSQRFMEAFELWMTYYAIRDIDSDNKADLFYDSPREFQEQEEVIQETLKAALHIFIEDPAEAKNSQGVVSGLDSSALPNAPETSEASIPEGANA